MKIKAKNITALTNDKGEAIIQITAYDRRNALYGVSQLKDKDLSVEIIPYRKKRSLTQNSYLWKLISEIASVVKSDIDSVYLGLLERYGVCGYMSANKNTFERIKQTYKTAKIIDEKQQDGFDIVKILFYFGSSTYNSKEMSTLIDGVVYEAKELGIEVMTPDEIARLKE